MKKSRTFTMLALVSVVSMSGCGKATSAAISASTVQIENALIEIATDGHGVLSLSSSDSSMASTGGKVALGATITVTATADEGYVLSTLMVNGTDIASTKTFTATTATNYIVSASFSKTSGDTLIKLTGATGVEVGKTTKLSSHVYGPDANLVYTSSDNKIATIDQNGVVTGVTPGFVTLTATSALSTATNPLSASFTLFVEPSYVVPMVSSMQGYDYANGVSFPGKLSLMLGAPADDTTEEEGTLSIDYALALKNTVHTLANGSTFTLPSINLSLVPPTSMSPLTYMLLANFGFCRSDFVGYDLNFASLDCSAPVFYSQQSVASATDSTTKVKGQYGIYSKINLASAVSSSSVSVSGLIAAALNYNVPAIVSDPSSFLATAGQTLNAALTYSTDASEGISVKPAVITKLNEALVKAVDTIKNSTTLNQALAAILSQVIPTNITDIRFKVVNSDTNEFQSLSLVVTASGKNSDDNVVTYHPLSYSLTKPTALAEDYFETLEKDFQVCDSDVALVNDLKTKEAPLYQTVKAYGNDLYDTLNFSKTFASDVKTYNAFYNTTLPNIVNKPLIPDRQDSSGGIDFVYGPYEIFQVSNKDGYVLRDGYAPKAGESLTLSAISAVGIDDTTAFTAPTDYDITFTAPTGETKDDYFTLADNVLTIKKLPAATDKNRTITIKPKAVDGYKQVSYKLTLNKLTA
jgi:hypothetical protein